MRQEVPAVEQMQRRTGYSGRELVRPARVQQFVFGSRPYIYRNIEVTPYPSSRSFWTSIDLGFY